MHLREHEYAFSEEALFKFKGILGFDTPLVLKSESAVCAVAAKLLLLLVPKLQLWNLYQTRRHKTNSL